MQSSPPSESKKFGMTSLRAVDRNPAGPEPPLSSGGNGAFRESGVVEYPACLPRSRSVSRAFHFTAGKLAGKTRGRQDEPALFHSVRVAQILINVFGMRGCRHLVTALLHDVLEDSDTDYDEIEEMFGVQVADAVVLLTKPMVYPKPLRKEIN